MCCVIVLMIMSVKNIDLVIIRFLRKWSLPIARVSIFIVFFWFGLLKLLDISQAEPVAIALSAKTIGLEHFELVFKILAIFECIIGILFLIPKATRVVIALLLFHMAVVCSTLFLVPELTWQKPLVPTLAGQYILKNMVIIALALGIAAHVDPIKKTRKN